MYSSAVHDEQTVRGRIMAACEAVDITPGSFDRVRHSPQRRSQACIEAGGGHFEHSL